MTQYKKKSSLSLYVVDVAKQKNVKQNQMQALHQRWQQVRKLEGCKVRIDEYKQHNAFIRKALEEQYDGMVLETAKNDSVH